MTTSQYVYIDGVAEHRAVWESHYGKLPKGWDVHHVDENKANNDISNLVALPHGVHFRVHDEQYAGSKQYTRAALLEKYFYYRGLFDALAAEQAHLQSRLAAVTAQLDEMTVYARPKPPFAHLV